MGWSREHGALLESFASWVCLRLVGAGCPPEHGEVMQVLCRARGPPYQCSWLTEEAVYSALQRGHKVSLGGRWTSVCPQWLVLPPATACTKRDGFP